MPKLERRLWRGQMSEDVGRMAEESERKVTEGDAGKRRW